MSVDVYLRSDDSYLVTFSDDNYEAYIVTTVTSSGDKVHDWINNILYFHRRRLSRLIVGLDIEWRPNNAFCTNPVAVIQLCVGRRCLIFQILHADHIPDSLANFLSDYYRFTFVGVAIKGDVEKIDKDYGLEVCNFRDLAEMAAEKMGRRDLIRVGLKRLALEVMGVRVNKPKCVTLSPWDNQDLSESQVGYACVDAFLSFEIGRMLAAGFMDGRLNQDPTLNPPPPQALPRGTPQMHPTTVLPYTEPPTRFLNPTPDPPVQLPSSSGISRSPAPTTPSDGHGCTTSAPWAHPTQPSRTKPPMPLISAAHFSPSSSMERGREKSAAAPVPSPQIDIQCRPSHLLFSQRATIPPSARPFTPSSTTVARSRAGSPCPPSSPPRGLFKEAEYHPCKGSRVEESWVRWSLEGFCNFGLKICKVLCIVSLFFCVALILLILALLD